MRTNFTIDPKGLDNILEPMPKTQDHLNFLCHNFC